jgi:hypothetical protein
MSEGREEVGRRDEGSGPGPGSDAPRDAHGVLVTRREAIQRVSMLLGGVALIGGEGLLTGFPVDAAERRDRDPWEYTDADVAFLDEVADTILPETSTPGAKAAATGAFMALTVRDVYSLENQAVFVEGMEALEARCLELQERGFMAASPEERLALLQVLDQEQYDYMEARAAVLRGDESPVPGVTRDSPPHWFRMMKELALLGYFTSEIGYHQAQRYVETPGRFDPCAPHAPGDPAWAPHA